MTRFSANLGFLWAELPLPDAIRAAKAAGFDAVECHWPYDQDRAAVRSALNETRLPMLGLNTRRGDVAAGENGLSALPGREADARAAIDEAIDWAVALGVPNIHVMAGFASGEKAHDAFVANLAYACSQAAPKGLTILIEPLNGYDAPGYFLSTTTQAEALIAQVGAENLKLMFDCYHVQLSEGDLTNRLKRLLPIIGHIQFAGVPARGRPDVGEVHYPFVFEQIAALGHTAPLGAEYKPGGSTEATLGWMGKT
ncbi:hydroxypyruvate isomerase family protein [Pseudoruegeria sp. SHC-113]|uniref:hydroxypyruvate isomerase family protein n=1 Tax=Pseudoruegeria sp. SHC-113 TaxID=2855439 RepID=UPI0021BA63FC|nr:TIM barrel protein [Pseudoruegeria sp. SHC-113]MCT8160359.1 TIM barrel protein [Pseudoruegeria sp. SHC-113]